jgi:hypothetical protein
MTAGRIIDAIGVVVVGPVNPATSRWIDLEYGAKRIDLGADPIRITGDIWRDGAFVEVCGELINGRDVPGGMLIGRELTAQPLIITAPDDNGPVVLNPNVDQPAAASAADPTGSVPPFISEQNQSGALICTPST